MISNFFKFVEIVEWNVWNSEFWGESSSVSRFLKTTLLMLKVLLNSCRVLSINTSPFQRYDFHILNSTFLRPLRRGDLKCFCQDPSVRSIIFQTNLTVLEVNILCLVAEAHRTWFPRPYRSSLQATFSFNYLCEDISFQAYKVGFHPHILQAFHNISKVLCFSILCLPRKHLICFQGKQLI